MACDHHGGRLSWVFFGAILLVTGVASWRTGPTPPKSCPTKSIPHEQKFDCWPGFNQTEEPNKNDCYTRGCCWEDVDHQNKSGPYNPDYPESRYPIHVGVPLCFYPSDYPQGYKTVNHSLTNYGMVAFLELVHKSPYPDDVTLLRLDVYMETASRLRVKIIDAEHERYEVPVPRLPTIDTAATNTDYFFSFDVNTASFSVGRKSTKEIIFETSVRSFVYANHFIQLSSKLPSDNLYGLGQHNDHFRRSLDWQLIPLFASLLYPDYGSHPFYLALEKSSWSHGVFLFNSNAMDVFLQPTPAITYRTTGGILDLYFFLGPEPESVIQQYTTLIGKPILPPYWSLGFQLCKYNYGSADNTRAVWARNVQQGIPLDVQWNDIDYLDNYKAFTYDPKNFKDLPGLVSDIHEKHMKYVSIGECGIYVPPASEQYDVYDEGVKLDIFIKNGTGTGYATGKVWPDHCVFPDFTHPSTQFFWTNGYRRLYEDIKFDGAWIDMDEPTTFTYGTVEDNGCPKDEKLQYTPAIEGGNLARHTICMGSELHDGTNFNLHNIYGFTEGIATNQALKDILNKRPFVLSRSTFPGFGHYGSHWTGDVYSSWHDLKQSIPAILNYNMYGIPMVGSDICGFREDTTLELCQRWTALGAFYPFSRNHNDYTTIEQDPVALGKEMVNTAKETLGLRYQLLPYMYTQFFRAHMLGGTVVRPVFFEFPGDATTHGIDEQFFWGRDLLVVPVLEEEATTVEAYLPEGLWYTFPQLEIINSQGATYKFNVALDQITLALRGGAVIVTHIPSQTTYDSRRNPFQLIVGLDDNLEADGELYWDDGDSLDPIENNEYTHITFTAIKGSLVSSVEALNYFGDVPMILDAVQIVGVPNKPERVEVNNQIVQFTYQDQTLLLSKANIPLSQAFSVTWGNVPTTTRQPHSSTQQTTPPHTPTPTHTPTTPSHGGAEANFVPVTKTYLLMAAAAVIKMLI